MAKKGNFKELLMKKGEKIGLIAAIGVFILFLLIGVTSMSGAVNPVQQKQKIDQAASSVQRSVDDATSKATPLPGEIYGKPSLSQVSADAFPNQNATFEPTNYPSKLRDNPLVKAPIESQVNYFAGSYKGYDRQFSVNNSGELSVRVAVLKVQTKQEFNWGGLQQRMEPPKKTGRPRTPAPVGAPPVNPMQPPPLNPGAPPAPGGGEGEMPPGPGGRIGGPINGERDDVIVQYMSYDEAKNSKLPPARTIYPIRMAVVQLSFPLKEQLEEIKRSLRLPNLAAAKFEASPATIDARSIKPGIPGVPGAAPVAPPAPVAVAPAPGGVNVGGTAMIETGDSPAFLGLIVERRVTGPDGQASGWEAFDHQEKFFERFSRYDTPFVQEDGYLPYFLRPYQGLSSPLPVMAGGYLLNYPPNISLRTIYENYQKLLADKAPKKVAAELEKQFKKGETNPYAPAPAGQAGNQPGGFGGGEEARPGAITAPPAGGRPGMGEGLPAPIPGNPAVPGVGLDLNKLEVEYILLRYLDTDLRPGHTYEYRVKVRMKNPNFNNPTQVANESMAAEEVLESAWFEVTQKVTVPTESFLYAYSAKKYEENVKKMYDDAGKPDVLNRIMDVKDVQEGRKVVVQMQRWQEYLTFGTKQEPIGAWIQAEMPVGPGDYIGRRTLVELPLWRSSIQDPNATKETLDPYSGGYTLPSPDAKMPMIAQWPADTGTRKYTLPRARILDFRTRDVLIDFDGGRVTTKVGTSTQTDDAAADLLILREDGKIEIRKEAIDMANTLPLTPRAQREKTWEEWLTRVRKQSEITAPGTGAPGTGFGPVRGGSGG